MQFSKIYFSYLPTYLLTGVRIYTPTPVSTMKDMVRLRSSTSPYSFCWRVVSWDHVAARSWSCRLHLCRNLLLRNYKAQSFYFWYIALSGGPLPKFFKLCPWGKNWPHPWGHNFTLNYIRKSLNDIFSWTANGNLTKLNRNGLCLIPYQTFSNCSDWLHK